jgi:hypothetical protein
MENWIQVALTQWREDEVKLNPPATAADFEKAEVVLNFNFPDDFKALYTAVNGFEDCDWQKHMFSFWSLDRIIEEINEQSDFIGFCDFLLMSNVICFKRGSQGIFREYPSTGEKDHNPIAQKFETVVYMINNSLGEIY